MIYLYLTWRKLAYKEYRIYNFDVKFLIILFNYNQKNICLFLAFNKNKVFFFKNIFLLIIKYVSYKIS